MWFSQFLFWNIKNSGYMSPEYALEGLFSIKSDVFAFGVVVLEIISGKRNMEFFEDVNLTGYVGTDNFPH